MRASREHMEKTRSHILDAAGKGFREKGYGGLGINGLAERAGMTSGAFYGHFSSKNEAFKEVVTAGMQDYKHAVSQFIEQHGENWADAFFDYYLGKAHVDNLACSCAVPALSADVVRSDKETKTAYAKACEEIGDTLTQGMAKEDSADALALMALLSGAVIMARSMPHKKQSQAILDAARHWANQIVSST